MPAATRISTDLYGVLGVDAQASGDDLARAFRARAKQLHPDANGDPDAAHRFNDLVAAYGVLSNHRTRREYDAKRERVETVHGGVAAERVVVANEPPVTKRWSHRRALTALIAGMLLAVLGTGAAVLTWQLHHDDAERHARFHPVTAQRVANGEIMFVAGDGRVVRTKEPQQHGEGNGLGPTVRVRYDPANPEDVIVDSNTLGRDITLAVVALKLFVGGVVFAVLGARRLRDVRRRPRAAR